ncbi:MAG: purine-binding chemotaxis protein CheW [Clostridia bacterium]|nr:purine-binding chemotaxis protein CheW [Clostridia bacterium]
MLKEMQIVGFMLGEEEYGVDILSVNEILKMTKITRVPKSSEYVKGVINLRGNVVPILNVRKKFKGEEKIVDDTTRIIILTVNENRFGIIVDNVTEVIRIKEEDIEEPNLIDSIDKKYVDGVGKYNGRLLILLKLDQILTITGSEELKVE